MPGRRHTVIRHPHFYDCPKKGQRPDDPLWPMASRADRVSVGPLRPTAILAVVSTPARGTSLAESPLNETRLPIMMSASPWLWVGCRYLHMEEAVEHGESVALTSLWPRGGPGGGTTA